MKSRNQRRTGRQDLHFLDENLSKIGPRGRESTWFWVKRDGTLVLHTTRGAKRQEQTNAGYVHRDCGGTYKVIFAAESKIRVEHHGSYGY
jgi:hypothetical protein